MPWRHRTSVKTVHIARRSAREGTEWSEDGGARSATEGTCDCDCKAVADRCGPLPDAMTSASTGLSMVLPSKDYQTASMPEDVVFKRLQYCARSHFPRLALNADMRGQARITGAINEETAYNNLQSLFRALQRPPY